MKRRTTEILVILVLAFSVLLVSCSKKEQAKEPQTLKIYSIIHEEETQALVDLFTKQTGIQVEFLRATTGELVNRVMAEKADPQADILLGGASSYHIQLDADGALEKYNSPAAAGIPEYAKSSDSTWTGFCVLTLGVGINEDRYKAKYSDIPVPQTWEDLLNPAYKGEIVLTNPVSSSTAYLFVEGQLQNRGWDEGWKYLTSLSELVGQFPDSGSAPAKLVGTGEYTIGIAYIHSIAKYRAEGFNVSMIAPAHTVGDVDCISILKGAKNMDAAKKFVDFMLSKEAQELMSSIDFTIPVNKDAKGAEGSVAVSDLDLIDYDTDKAAQDKDSVLKKWTETVR